MSAAIEQRHSFLGLRDPLAGLTHALGAAGAMAALVLLLIRAVHYGTVWHFATFSIFGLGMFGLYMASTLYHWIPYGEVRTRRLRKFDHVMIFVFIAASYTPICLIPLRGGWGWSLFVVVWIIVVLGTLMKFFWLTAPRFLSTGCYIAMGWAACVAIWPLVNSLPVGALIWLAAGGMAYTVGGVVYAFKRPDPWPKVFGFHEIFHCLVLLGSFCHFWVMYAYVAHMS